MNKFDKLAESILNDPDYDSKKTLMKSRNGINYNFVEISDKQISDLRNKYNRSAVYKLKNGDVVEITASRFSGAAIGEVSGIKLLSIDNDKLVKNEIKKMPNLKNMKFIAKGRADMFMPDKDLDKVKKELK